MQEEHEFSIRTFWVTVLLNTVLLGATYMAAGDALRVQEQLIGYLLIWAVITVSLWLLVRYYGQRMATRLSSGWRRGRQLSHRQRKKRPHRSP